MQKTLKKVLEELNKEIPRLDYIRGMLEVLVEDDKENKYPNGVTPMKAQEDLDKYINNPVIANNGLDEASILDAKARASLETIKALAGQSSE